MACVTFGRISRGRSEIHGGNISGTTGNGGSRPCSAAPALRIATSLILSAETPAATAAFAAAVVAARRTRIRSMAAETLASFAFSPAAPVSSPFSPCIFGAIAYVNREDYMNTAAEEQRNEYIEHLSRQLRKNQK